MNALRPENPAVRARGITRCFDEVVALDGIDLDVPAGQVHGIVGPNGAGKSTLLGLLLGLSRADGGSLDVLGHPLAAGRPGGIHRGLDVPDGVAGFVDAPGLYPSLTARQNLLQLARLRGLPDAGTRATRALDEVGLTDVADDRVRGFSLGMRQRLGLAAALLTEPRLLVLDEPSNGLDPAGRQHVDRVLQRLAARGTAIVLSSHRMDDLARLCDEVTLLSSGRVVFTGTTTELAERGQGTGHRLVTTDQQRTRQVAALVEGVEVAPLGRDGALVLRCEPCALDGLLAVLARQGIGLRELSPAVPPLEAAFLALTGDGRASAFPGQGVDRPGTPPGTGAAAPGAPALETDRELQVAL